MRPPKRIVILSSVEYQLLFHGLLHFRNKLIQQGRYTDAVDELLIKLQKARSIPVIRKQRQLKKEEPRGTI